MIGNGFEFYFHWRKTFDAMTTKKKVQRSHFPTILPHCCTNFYGSKSLTFPCASSPVLVPYCKLTRHVPLHQEGGNSTLAMISMASLTFRRSRHYFVNVRKVNNVMADVPH